MDYFFRSQTCTFNLENNKRICQGNFFAYHVTGSTYFRIIFQAMIFQGYIQNFEKNLRNSICITVKDTHRKKVHSNKTSTLLKSINMNIWVIGTSNQLFI